MKDLTTEEQSLLSDLRAGVAVDEKTLTPPRFDALCSLEQRGMIWEPSRYGWQAGQWQLTPWTR